MACSNCGGNCGNTCQRTVIDSKGEKGDRGPQGPEGPAGTDGSDGADGLSQFEYKAVPGCYNASPTSVEANPNWEMVDPEVLYLDLPEGDWVIEYSAKLISISNDLNNEIYYSIAKDDDLTGTVKNSGDVVIPITERIEVIRDPDQGGGNSLYTRAHVTVPSGETHRFKVFYSYIEDNDASDDYAFCENILSGTLYQNVNAQ
jgi:hypothetical protein